MILEIFGCVDGIRHVRGGDFRSRLALTRADEIGALIYEFNAMVAALETARRQAEEAQPSGPGDATSGEGGQDRKEKERRQRVRRFAGVLLWVLHDPPEGPRPGRADSNTETRRGFRTGKSRQAPFRPGGWIRTTVVSDRL